MSVSNDLLCAFELLKVSTRKRLVLLDIVTDSFLSLSLSVAALGWCSAQEGNGAQSTEEQVSYVRALDSPTLLIQSMS